VATEISSQTIDLSFEWRSSQSPRSDQRGQWRNSTQSAYSVDIAAVCCHSQDLYLWPPANNKHPKPTTITEHIFPMRNKEELVGKSTMLTDIDSRLGEARKYPVYFN